MDPIVENVNVAATGQVRNGSGKVYGVIVNSHSSGTLKLWDALTATGTVVIDTFSFPTGSGIYKFPEPLPFATGLFATVGGTLNCQLILTPRNN